MEQKITTPIVKGVILSLILVVFGLIIYFTGQYTNTALNYLQYAVLIGGIIWSCTSYAKQMNANVTFGNVFAHGFKTTAVIIVIMVLYSVLAVKLIFPDMTDQVIEQAKKQMESNKNLTDEQIQQALDITRKFFVTFMIGGIILMFAIFGAIAAAIGAAVAKKNPQAQDPFAQKM